jgi:type II secretory pathway pseudopilin PulG
VNIRSHSFGVKAHSRERGYILLTMLLFVALLAIGATAAVARIDMQIRRDREEEMIHRGVQYSRAIRHYVKKFGRYPTSIEDLEDTNNIRFLRKRYKDPITGKDFKLLHIGEVQTIMGAGIAGAVPAGALAAAGQAGGPAGAAVATNGPGSSSGFSLGPTPSTNTTSVAPGTASAGGAATTAQSGTQSDSSQNTGAAASTASDSSSSSSSSNGPSPGNGQVFGGGPIVGVASTSKEKSIRVFNNKDHYNEWQFIYDPTTDRGGLLNTPYQPALQGSVNSVPGQTGTPATGAAPNSGFGGQNNPMQPQMPPTGQAPQQP